MDGMLIIGGILGIVVNAIVIGILVKLQQRGIGHVEKRQQAWERAQDIRQQQWKTQQEKRVVDLEQQLMTQVEHLHSDWKAWEAHDAIRMDSIAQHYTTAHQHSQIELEIARLPRVEDAPLGDYEQGYRQPAQLREANLSQRDLSHRYLGQADLRDAQLVNANLFMSDLSGACLAGANLSNANLAGANLSHADLRGAILIGTNLLVADLNNALLFGAHLLKARSLTVDQLAKALYDSTTRLDSDFDVTQPRIPTIAPRIPGTPTTPFEAGENPIRQLPETPLPILPVNMPEAASSTGQEAPVPAHLVSQETLHDLVKLPIPIDQPESRQSTMPRQETPDMKRNGRKQARAS